MKKFIAIIDKAPSKTDYKKYFDFDFEVFHMSSMPIPSGTRFVKKMIDLDIDLDLYDLVILVGSEASKEYAGVTSVTNMQGQLKGKFTFLSNPSILVFKPEGKNDFDKAVKKISGYVEGKNGDVATGDYAGINNYEEAKAFLLEVLNSEAPFIAMDTEGTALAPRDGYVLGISISHKPKFGRYILTDLLDDALLNIIQLIINKYIIVFHNLKYDVKMMEYHLGLVFNRETCEDTMIMHYVLDENDSHGLKHLALKYTDFGDYDAELEEFKANYCKTYHIKSEDFTYDLIPFEIICKYASIDTAVTYFLRTKFLPIIMANAKLLGVYRMLMRGTFFLNDMEEVGIPINRDKLTAAGEYLQKRIEELKEKMYSFDEIKRFEKDNNVIFNPNSVVQLRKVLFDYLGLTPTGKLTATGAISTDAEVLEELSDEHPLPEVIHNIRKTTKILSTYVLKILPELDKDSAIRTSFNLIFTTSGRLSSSGKFNAQQIIRDDPIIKGCIEVPEGYSIISQDLQTGEMYYAAVLSGDKNLQQVFATGGDFHSAIAKMVFDLDCPVEEVKKKYPHLRQSAKAISFGILYGSGPAKVAATVSKATGEHYSLERAKQDIDAYFSKFNKLKKWLDERKAFILANGYTYSFFGRKRRLPNVTSADKSIASHEVRSGINSEIQSLCSDINLLGAMDAAEEFLNRKIPAKIFALVHDSIVVTVQNDYVDIAKSILKECVQKDRGCSIPGYPIGIEQDVGKEYSFGKFDEVYKFDGTSISRISDRE